MNYDSFRAECDKIGGCVTITPKEGFVITFDHITFYWDTRHNAYYKVEDQHGVLDNYTYWSDFYDAICNVLEQYQQSKKDQLCCEEIESILAI